MQPYQQRVVDEKAELDIKATKLSDFIGYNPLFEELETDEQELLKEQNDVMWQYSEILGKRITAFEKYSVQKQCDDFNAKYPVGSEVLLKKDFIDEPVRTTVSHAAYILSGHSAVAHFEGISGCYLISCVKGPCV